MSFRTVTAVIGACLLAATLSACASGPSSAADAVGEWKAEAPNTAWLSIDDDGTVTGSDGCNPVNGTAETSAGTVRFTLEFTTLKACLGVTTSFKDLATATVDGDTMMTINAAGEEIIELQRS